MEILDDDVLSNSSGDVRSDISPGGTAYHIPVCDKELVPIREQNFMFEEDEIDFYRIYGRACGFDTRRGPTKKWKDKVVDLRYVYCNRQGEKNAVVEEGECDDDVGENNKKRKRRKVSNKIGCKASILLKYSGVDGYTVHTIEYRHNHPLISDFFKRYLKVNRKLEPVHQEFIMRCVRANIGAMKSFRLFKEFAGSYDSVGTTGIDFKNYARDLRAYIAGVDAQLILDKLAMKKSLYPAFFFDKCVDEKDRLTRLFWADPISRRNYSMFGDVVSFDSTYSTNRYAMIFAPFTGRDNHGKIVTFGAGLVSGENSESFVWLFEKFKECMGRGPGMIITDQDRAMKVAVKEVFPDSKHRLCMWHIMVKVPEKLPAILRHNDEFRSRFYDVVWSNIIEPSDFEEQWKTIMAEYGLMEDDWFSTMFDIRENWIAAYFRDVPMSGVCRTTSISESVNSVFNIYLNKNSNLVEFFVHFDSAIDAQRHSVDIQNNVDYSTSPQLRTPLKIEKHASNVYTSEIFVKVQQEIQAACFDCSVVGIKEVNGETLYVVDDEKNSPSTVCYNIGEDNVGCSCNKFLREGLLCRHMFVILKQLKADMIPYKYIVARWTKSAFLNTLVDAGSNILSECVGVDDNNRGINVLMSEFYTCIGVAEGNKDMVNEMVSFMRDIRSRFLSLGDEASDDQHASSSSMKKKLFDRFYGMPAPSDVTVFPPMKVSVKGGSSRIKARKEAAIKRAEKTLRMCRKCKTMADHDSRNCNKVIVKI